MIERFKPKKLTKTEINLAAIGFLEDHPDQSSIPVDIEGIVDELRIDTIPLPGLKNMSRQAGLDADAFISSDFLSITVDQFIFDRRINRYRFTLAHELGHMVLHSEYYHKLSIDSTDEWVKIISALPKSIIEPFERQADEFAGRVLVPKIELLREFRLVGPQADELVQEEYPGLDDMLPKIYQQSVNERVIDILAKIFVVSPECMSVCLSKDKLIDRRR